MRREKERDREKVNKFSTIIMTKVISIFIDITFANGICPSHIFQH